MPRPAMTADTPAWTFQTWAAFVISLGATSIGVVVIDADFWEKAFLGLGLWFTVSSTLCLAKALRDRHESEKLVSKLDEARTEAVLRELSREAA